MSLDALFPGGAPEPLDTHLRARKRVRTQKEKRPMHMPGFVAPVSLALCVILALTHPILADKLHAGSLREVSIDTQEPLQKSFYYCNGPLWARDEQTCAMWVKSVFEAKAAAQVANANPPTVGRIDGRGEVSAAEKKSLAMPPIPQ